LPARRSGAGKGLGFRFAITFDKPLAAAGFTIPRSETTGKTEEEGETVWEAAFYNANGDLLSRQTARPGEGANVAALFGYIAGEGEEISKIVIGDIEEFYLAGGATGRMFFDDLGFAVAGGAGQVLLDYDFSTTDRMTMDLPNAAPWYFYRHHASTATWKLRTGRLAFTIPPADSWRPAGALIPFAEPGGVMLAVGEELVINAEITLDNVAFSEQGGFRWGVFNYGDGARPTGDDAVLGDFPGINVTGYVNSMLFHGNQTNDQYWFAKRTGVEDDSLLGRSGNFSWFDMEGKYLTSFDAETQVFFPNEPIHIQLVYSRVAEDEVVLMNTIMNAEGTILFQSEVSDTGLGEVGPYTTFDSFVFRAQVTGGSATGGVQGDPRAGIEEVISTMHFSQLKVEVRDIPSSGVLLDYDFSTPDRMTMDLPNAAPWYFWQHDASTATLEAEAGSIGFTLPPMDSWRPAGALIPFAEPGGVMLAVGEELVINAEITLDNVAFSEQGGFRWGVFNYGDGARPTGDDAVLGDFPGIGVTGYVNSMLFHGNQTNDQYWFAKRTGVEDDSLLGRSGNFSWFDMDGKYLTSFDPETQVFFPNETIHIQLVYSRVAEDEVVLMNTIMNAEGTIVFQSEVSDTGLGDVDPYTTFDSFVFRAQVTGGSATGGVQGDPRAGVEEVISTMHFSQLKVEVRDIPPTVGPVLLDHDFSSGDRGIKNLPDSAAWIFTKDSASTSTLEAQEGSISWTIPAVDSWRPAGSAISFADPGGVTVGVGQSLKVKFAVTLDNIPENTVGNQRGIRWGLFNFGGAEAEQPAMDDLENPAFNGVGTTGYHVSFSFHSNAENQMARFAKRTNLETEGLIGSFGAWTAWNIETEETQYLVELDPEVQAFFPDELYRVEIGVNRINELEVHMTLKIMDDAGTVLFSSKVVDTGFGDVDPYVSFDTFVFRAQVSAGTATGSQAGDPRAGIEEVTSSMHFSEMRVELVPLVPDIPLGDLPWQQEGLEIGDIVFDPWFGSFEIGGNDWVRHGELGWLYVGFVEDSTDMWMYGLVRNSWLWSSESSFPIVYDYTAAKWIYYFLLPDGGGYYLYDYVTGNWGWNP
jgi:hypothetical protein